MAGLKEARVYRLEYDMNESNWQAYIAAFSQEEAVKQLYDNVPGRIKKLTGTHQQCRLDMVSNAIKFDLNFESREQINRLMKDIGALREELELLKQAKDLRTIPKKK